MVICVHSTPAKSQHRPGPWLPGEQLQLQELLSRVNNTTTPLHYCYP
jgi:hypothetical protein